MSYDDTHCPCGGEKPPGTMLCDLCLDFLKDRKELKDFQDTSLSLDWRAHAAHICCALSHARKRQQGEKL